MKRFYHLTPAGNTPRILQEGLLPSDGALSQRALEYLDHPPAVYLYTKLSDALEDRKKGWYRDAVPAGSVDVLEIELKEDVYVRYRFGWEALVFEAIPPGCIRVHQETEKGKRDENG